jgi:hypothetical protein
VSSERGLVPRSSTTVTMFKAESYVGYKLCWPDDLVISSLQPIRRERKMLGSRAWETNGRESSHGWTRRPASIRLYRFPPEHLHFPSGGLY